MEACRSLHDVLQRIFVKEDRRKLEAIHQTFLSRTDELDDILGNGTS
ncbi:hypothetical protein SMACR_12817 [Sordaria macrospora]|uniref:WGS project CABT00000000 data, contig 2.70 n=2 Tax=Sordaria macrospora TaxID=5147 RepID=F7WB58_SORMK|nr:uncharacterized protein SMAC_12817 [Sordaria macrospora k-hell]KAA8631099.1 hypothetical protein SMACR_12817 [Sordaria macrospora]WPJ63934.1 hypothetical protein SMAC4_12817 [Sordaria macrospora]CCC14350.1 unnamed protein product [Sordaria macrospora k-hell]